jgi:prepilin-type N-terminal cleavage/methylation domain-containing protein
MNRTLLLLSGRRATRRFSLRSWSENGSREPNGFTLMELLIVMAIIAILMLIAIPTVGSLKKSANRLSAIQSIRAIQELRFCKATSPRATSPDTFSRSVTAKKSQ